MAEINRRQSPRLTTRATVQAFLTADMSKLKIEDLYGGKKAQKAQKKQNVNAGFSASATLGTAPRQQRLYPFFLFSPAP